MNLEKAHFVGLYRIIRIARFKKHKIEFYIQVRVNGLWRNIQYSNTQTCIEQFDSGPDGSKYVGDTLKAISQTQNLRT